MAAPFITPSRPVSHQPPRFASLDVVRGLIVAVMILVNTSMAAGGLDSFDSYPILQHADWEGFTLADFVFPAFIFVVGFSLALSVSRESSLGTARLKQISARSLRLFLAGIVLGNFVMYWMQDWAFDGFRPMGVLQRIAICYFFTAIMFITMSSRARILIAVGILVLYWPLTLLTVPGAVPVNLHSAGANFVSWVDRAMLGSHIYVTGPLGFDPEGILSTLPAIAQCLLGAASSEWLLRASKGHGTRNLLAGGLGLSIIGWGWSLSFPLVKALWTSSFVLLSSGLTMVLLAGFHRLLDEQSGPRIFAVAFAPFGRNAILAYCAHILLMFVVTFAGMRWLHDAAARILSPDAASLVPALVYVLLLWLPFYYLFRRRIFIRI